MMKLTKLEAKALLHRLSIGDCIAECLTDYGSQFEDGPRNLIEKVADTLANRCELIVEGVNKTLDYGDLPADITIAVIRDAIEGSTWGYWLNDMVYDEETTPLIRAQHRRAMRSIERKAREAGIENDGFPT